MLRVNAVWSGGPMGTGVSVLNFGGAALAPTDVDDLLDAATDFFAAFAAFLPNTVTVKVSNEVEVRNDGTGAIISTVGGLTQPTTTGSFSSGYWAGVGARVRWPTGLFRNGRPITGTTFIVPLAGNVIATDGTLGGSFQSDALTAANALIGVANANGTPIGVWSKPTTVGGTDGEWNIATGASVPDQVSWLTSRRR